MALFVMARLGAETAGDDLVQLGMQAEAKKQYAQAYQAYSQAYDQKNNLGTALLANLLMKGLGCKADPFKARMLFEGVLKGEGLVYMQNNTDNNFAASLMSSLGLADIEQQGLGVPRDPKKALKDYRKIILGLGTSGQATLASEKSPVLGLVGILVASPFAHTINLGRLKVGQFKKYPITRKVVGVVLYRIGMAYKEGIGTSVKKKKALKFLNKAVEFGNEEAMGAVEALR
ncbi:MULTISPECIES: hypothetical protein [unclassified Helicobacter]|uniref:hypothetical protein n=1 Tax=Helicobacter sp. NHP22-001 TaxID=3040202 RepID=UPI001C856D11|nr:MULTISPECIES: hypothetical protein [unclassified Helicobacter]